MRTSLVVQGLRFWTSNAQGAVSIPGCGTKSPSAMWYGQERKKKKKKRKQNKWLTRSPLENLPVTPCPLPPITTMMVAALPGFWTSHEWRHTETPVQQCICSDKDVDPTAGGGEKRGKGILFWRLVDQGPRGPGAQCPPGQKERLEGEPLDLHLGEVPCAFLPELDFPPHCLPPCHFDYIWRSTWQDFFQKN